MLSRVYDNSDAHRFDGARRGGVQVLMTRAGLPTAMELAGMSRVTTAPAPMIEFSPMVTPGHTTTEPPSHTLSSMVIGAEDSHFARRGPGSVGWIAV